MKIIMMGKKREKDLNNKILNSKPIIRMQILTRIIIAIIDININHNLISRISKDLIISNSSNKLQETIKYCKQIIHQTPSL